MSDRKGLEARNYLRTLDERMIVILHPTKSQDTKRSGLVGNIGVLERRAKIATGNSDELAFGKFARARRNQEIENMRRKKDDWQAEMSRSVRAGQILSPIRYIPYESLSSSLCKTRLFFPLLNLYQSEIALFTSISPWISTFSFFFCQRWKSILEERKKRISFHNTQENAVPREGVARWWEQGRRLLGGSGGQVNEFILALHFLCQGSHLPRIVTWNDLFQDILTITAHTHCRKKKH